MSRLSKGPAPVRFESDTPARESDAKRREIIESPPDILLTNLCDGSSCSRAYR